MLMYQIKIAAQLFSETGKRIQTPNRKSITLKPHVSINEAQYWQNRIYDLIPGADVMCRVAK